MYVVDRKEKTNSVSSIERVCILPDLKTSDKKTQTWTKLCKKISSFLDLFMSLDRYRSTKTNGLSEALTSHV